MAIDPTIQPLNRPGEPLPLERFELAVKVEYVHAVSSECVIMLHQWGIIGKDIDNTIDRMFPASHQLPNLHIRYNLKGEQAAVCAAYKGKGKARVDTIDISSDDDDEVEVVTTVQKRSIKREPGSSPPSRRPRLVIDIPDSLPISALSSSTPTSASTPATSASTPATTPPPSSSQPKWPTGVYTVDMAAGLMRMDSMELAGMAQDARFENVFGEPYVRSTFGDSSHQWKAGSQSLKEHLTKAGWSPAGLWSVYRMQLREEEKRKNVSR
ncbi:hypothetical protein DFH07DRAFT_958124 [Mycena maculata]|uniref:Uncharacterized protein n=1 Tax=Mycena maculata TaxID=230809 RepID=A0AAD7J7R1_9AGAR|nr:hypothetical protein DFH07DRAFT_958124 [Mycena maculata]